MKTRLELKNICIRKTKDNSPEAKNGFDDDLATGEQIIASILKSKGFQLYKTETLSLTSGTETYDLASDVDEIEQLLITSPTADEKELVRVDKEEFRKTNPVTSNDSTSTPSYWYFSEPTIGSDNTETKRVSFYPIPDGAYTVTYSYKSTITGMDADGDYPFFAGRYHHILADYAIWQYAEREADPTMNPNYWENKWEKGLALLTETFYDQTKHLEPINGPDQYEPD